MAQHNHPRLDELKKWNYKSRETVPLSLTLCQCFSWTLAVTTVIAGAGSVYIDPIYPVIRARTACHQPGPTIQGQANLLYNSRDTPDIRPIGPGQHITSQGPQSKARLTYKYCTTCTVCMYSIVYTVYSIATVVEVRRKLIFEFYLSVT